MADNIKKLNVAGTEYVIRPEFAQKLETYYQGDLTKTYGTSYPLYAQWYTNTRLKLNVDGYTTEADWAWKLTNSSGLLNVGSSTQPVYFSAGVPVATVKFLPLTGGTLTGKITIDMSNPHFCLKDTAYSTNWYFQAYQDQLAFGPTFDSAVKTDKNGNMTVPGTVTVENKVKLDYDATYDCLNFVFV